jgi:hypothetical protein
MDIMREKNMFDEIDEEMEAVIMLTVRREFSIIIYY